MLPLLPFRAKFCQHAAAVQPASRRKSSNVGRSAAAVQRRLDSRAARARVESTTHPLHRIVSTAAQTTKPMHPCSTLRANLLALSQHCPPRHICAAPPCPTFRLTPPQKPPLNLISLSLDLVAPGAWRALTSSVLSGGHATPPVLVSTSVASLATVHVMSACPAFHLSTLCLFLLCSHRLMLFFLAPFFPLFPSPLNQHTRFVRLLIKTRSDNRSISCP